ncbi:hypothetical protein BLNAU_192 [Blattamonas nauphoetae]|uniref:Uncharacterized protein n=1 Tax=Blattamonas nauphoetae TaxID=2049346 RepID=A0ABQ9YMA5_9EUKA|nr:hypothetical protein BLNAU_192 [Blattamonas nauphoetae]
MLHLFSYFLLVHCSTLDKQEESFMMTFTDTLTMAFQRCMMSCVGITDDIGSCVSRCLNDEWARGYITLFESILSHTPEPNKMGLCAPISTGSSSNMACGFLPAPPKHYSPIKFATLSKQQLDIQEHLARCIGDLSTTCAPMCHSLTQDWQELQDCTRLCQANTLKQCAVTESLPILVDDYLSPLSGPSSRLRRSKTKQQSKIGKKRGQYLCWGLSGSLNSTLSQFGFGQSCQQLDFQRYEDYFKDCLLKMFNTCDLKCGMDSECHNACVSENVGECTARMFVSVRNQIDAPFLPEIVEDPIIQPTIADPVLVRRCLKTEGSLPKSLWIF